MTEKEVVVTSASLSAWAPYRLTLAVPAQGRLVLSVGADRLDRPVLFDDLEVQHRGGYVVQEQHTYPYGSPIVGLSLCMRHHPLPL